MKKATLLSAAMLLACAFEVSAQELTERLDSVVVSSSRAGSDTPVTFTSVGREELHSSNPVNSVPMTLGLQPSVVTYNEGGTGLGNSAITIRGVKGSQINVTLNGITLNDSESQEVFWVNIPSLGSLLSGVQLQRGLGTTANGSGAFGASINMNTAFVPDRPFASVDLTGGSYKTRHIVASAGSGLLGSGLYASVAYSEGATDGYIEHALVHSRSVFLNLGWLKGKNSLRYTYLMGNQKSGITWDGIDLETYAENRRYNASDRNTDNYFQQHFQLNYTRRINSELAWSNTLNYTRGSGFDEYYKKDIVPSDLMHIPSSASWGIPGEVCYRKRMANDYYVLNSELKYYSGALKLTGGVNLSYYGGDHYPQLISFETDPYYETTKEAWDLVLKQIDPRKQWYSNFSHKRDYSLFARGEYAFAKGLIAYADIQLRHVNLDMRGLDDDRVTIDFSSKGWTFLNPRAGVTWKYSPDQKAYASLSLGHREPGRSDIKENVKREYNPIRPETMLDFEAGWSYESRSLSLGADIYMMEYFDMLLETGKLSSSGYAIKENVPRAWRRGVELSAAWRPASFIVVDGNLTLSDNRIKDYVSYVPLSGYYVGGRDAVVEVPYGNSRMLLSPSVIGMLRATVQPWAKGPSLSISGKYVGRQYLDNSARDIMAIPMYFVVDAVLTQRFNLWGGDFAITAYVNNLLNRKYYASGWRYEGFTRLFTESDVQDEYYYGVGIYPQATRNAMLKLSLSF